MRELHRAGIKVILDVVYNHTGEGNEMGPEHVFRGLDNPSYYSLTGPAAAPLRYYMNYTGLRQQSELRQPGRYPPGDGFAALLVRDDARGRIPLRSGVACSAAAGTGRSNRLPAFFDAVAQDPVLAAPS